MGFEIRVEGEVAHTIEIDPGLVEKVHILGPRGEVGVMGSNYGDGFIDLTFEFRSRTNLEVIEAASQAANREDAEKEEIYTARPSGKLVGEVEEEKPVKKESVTKKAE